MLPGPGLYTVTSGVRHFLRQTSTTPTLSLSLSQARPKAYLGDDPSLAEALGQEGLTHGIVDLMGAGVCQLLPAQ